MARRLRSANSGDRSVLIVGALLIGVGLGAMLASFPFIARDPGPGHPAKTDPGWFRALGWICLGLIVSGGCIVRSGVDSPTPEPLGRLAARQLDAARPILLVFAAGVEECGEVVARDQSAVAHERGEHLSAVPRGLGEPVGLAEAEKA